MADMPLSDIHQDLDLLRRMRAGDRNAMTSLYERHQGPLYRFLLLRSGSADTASDIVQDVFVALIENKLAFDATRGALSSFLFGVARNFLLKRDEAQRRHVSLTKPDADDEDTEIEESLHQGATPGPMDALLESERAEAVRLALSRIKPHYRDVLILYEMQDLSYLEIAHICGIDIGTVRSRLSRGRARLLELLNTGEATAESSVAALKDTKQAVRQS